MLLRTKIYAIALMTVCACLWVYVFVSLNAKSPGSSDSGQWIVLARFYRGEPVPSYLKPSAYAPVYPISLAIAMSLTGNPLLAVNLLGAMIFVLLSVSFFVAAKELWDTTGGVIALFVASVGQFFFLYATSWGAYPELLFLAWTNFAVGSFVALYKNKEISLKRLSYLGLFVGLALFTHFPSAIILIAVFGLPSLHFLLTRMNNLANKEKIAFFSIVSAPFTAWFAYLTSHLQETLGYVGNEAALYTRGVNTVWFYLIRTPESSVFVAISLVAVVLALAWASRTKAKLKALGFYFVASWLFSTIILMCALFVAGTKTEYTRFTYLIVPPMILIVAGALSILIKTSITVNIEGLSPHRINLNRWGLAVVLILVMLAFPSVNAFYQDAIEYYAVEKPNDFNESIQWIKQNLLYNETVLTLQREGRWLEGLTGRPALLSFPDRASYRPWEHERSVSTDVLLTSSLAIENGYMLVKFQQAYDGVPIQPSVSVYREGSYVDAIWLRDSLTEISLITPSGEIQTLPLSNFQKFPYEVQRQPDEIRIITRFEKSIKQTVLYMNRTITVAQNYPVVYISYEFLTAGLIQAKNLSIGILDPWDQSRKDVLAGKELNLSYITPAKKEMNVRVTWNSSSSSIRTRSLSGKDKRPVTWVSFFPNATSRARLDLQIITVPTGRFTSDLRLYNPIDLLEKFNVKVALLPKDGNLWFRSASLKHLGFSKAFENNSYIILARSQNA